jgi:hypothetical protein
MEELLKEIERGREIGIEARNELQGMTSEYGLVAPEKLLHLRLVVPRWLKDN